MSQLETPQRSAQSLVCGTILENPIYSNDQTEPQIQLRSSECHWFLGRKKNKKPRPCCSKSQLHASGCLQRTCVPVRALCHEFERLQVGISRWLYGWQKISGTSHQLCTNTQQEDARDCIRGRRAGSGRKRGGGRASSESCVILLKSFRLWLNMARCFVLGVGFIYSNDLLTFNPYIHTRLKTRRSLLMSPQPRFFYFLIIIV